MGRIWLLNWPAPHRRQALALRAPLDVGGGEWSAQETLALLDPAKQAHAAPPPRTNRHLYDEANPLDLVPFAKKVALCQQVDAAARARDPRVVQVSVALAGSWSVVEIVRADGFVATDAAFHTDQLGTQLDPPALLYCFFCYCF